MVGESGLDGGGEMGISRNGFGFMGESAESIAAFKASETNERVQK